MRSVPIKNTGNTYSAQEFNELPSQELQNSVLTSGQSLNSLDANQLGKAMSVYGSAGDFYTDTGAANAYTLTPVGSPARQAPPSLTNGIRVRFVAGNTNTGASTINLNGIGPVVIKVDGVDLDPGIISAGALVEAVFESGPAEFSFVRQTKNRIYTTLAALKADASLRAGEQAFAEFLGDDKGKNTRQLYRIMSLIPTTNGPLVDDSQIIELANGLFAVSVQTLGDGNIPYYQQHLNMHFGPLKGIPFNQSETGGILNFTTSTTANVGDLVLVLTSVTGLVVDQLINFLADDGEYYSTVIESIVSTTLNLRTPIESKITFGGAVHNFYDNLSHANKFGFYTIVDYSLREIKHSLRKVIQINPDDWEPRIGSEVLTLLTTDDIHSPGSSETQYLEVTSSTVDFGAASQGRFALPEGQYLVRGYMNPGTANAGADENTVEIIIEETTEVSQALAFVTTFDVKGKNSSQVFEFMYFPRANTTQRIILASAGPGDHLFQIGKFEIFKIEDTLTNLDNSKHVLLGDSWFVNGGPDFSDRLKDRLPNAIIFDEGVGGNRASDLVIRFAADAAAHKPDYVWIMTGTNDYFSDISFDTFEANMANLKELISGIGAIPLIFDASVGEIDNVGEPQNFRRSRVYALQGAYDQSGTLIESQGGQLKEFGKFFVNEVNIPATTKIVVYIPPGTTQKSMTVLRSNFDSASVNVEAGYAATLAAVPVEDVISFAGNLIVSPEVNKKPVPKSNTNTRFMSVAIDNPTGGAIVVSGYIEIEYVPIL